MEFADYLRFIAALAFVVGLIGILALMARRFGMTPRITRKPGQRGKRLSIVDILPVDGKRRLLLIRRDDAEHLVLLGPNSETVVERGISADPAAPSEDSDTAKPFDFRDLPSLLRVRSPDAAETRGE